MIQIQIGQEKKDYPEGTAWKQVAEEYQKFYENDILLVNVNGKLQELHKGIREGRVKFITAADKPGMSAYQRSATLMMLKAFYEIVGAERIRKVSVDFSIGKGFFVDPEGDFQVTPQLLAQVKEKMKEYAEAAIPIYKRSVGTDDAVEEFRRHRMYDKARLFAYRRVSRVNLYSLEGFEDYYYGYMVQNTSYIRYFDLIPYHQGFVMLLPQMSSPRTLPQFIPQEKLFSVLEESSQWGKQMDLENVGASERPYSFRADAEADFGPGGPSGKENIGNRPADRREEERKVYHDCRTILFGKDYLRPSAQRAAGGHRFKAPSHFRGQLFC